MRSDDGAGRAGSEGSFGAVAPGATETDTLSSDKQANAEQLENLVAQVLKQVDKQVLKQVIKQVDKQGLVASWDSSLPACMTTVLKSFAS